jgi:Bacterial toxin 46
VDQREYWRRVATDFYQVYCPDRMGEVDFIDFNYPVRDVRIEKGTRLWGFKDPRVSPLRTTFFTNPGTPVGILGVHDAGNLNTSPKALQKVLNEYDVMVTVPHVLYSLCATGIDAWSEHGHAHPVGGGGWQYKVPQPARYIRYTTPFPQR